MSPAFAVRGPPCRASHRSRLGCQIKASPELEGMKIQIPEDSIDLS